MVIPWPILNFFMIAFLVILKVAKHQEAIYDDRQFVG